MKPTMHHTSTTLATPGVVILFLLFSCQKDDRDPAPSGNGGNGPNTPTDSTTVVDIDGNTYPTVTIGAQVWMAENLRTTRYHDGSTIQNVTAHSIWINLSTGAWRNYEDYAGYDAVYGKLYNGYAAAMPTICPQGWHVPTDTEWMTLETALGMPVEELSIIGVRGGGQNVGGKMKTTILWEEVWGVPETATNESGFSGLPSGVCDYGGGFYGLGMSGTWWSASVPGSNGAWGRSLFSSDMGIYRSYFDDKRYAYCVRCLRD